MMRATRYTIGSEQRREALHVERTHEDLGTWAVRYDGRVWGCDGWEWDLMPSSRDDAYLTRTRWTETEALAHAIRLWGEMSDLRRASPDRSVER